MVKSDLRRVKAALEFMAFHPHAPPPASSFPLFPLGNKHMLVSNCKGEKNEECSQKLDKTQVFSSFSFCLPSPRPIKRAAVTKIDVAFMKSRRGKCCIKKKNKQSVS